jgi:hypothetical protein
MISNAKDILLTANTGTLPNMAGTLLEWMQSITVKTIVKTVVDFKLVEAESIINTRGVHQPMNATQLEMKPIGQRQWNWETFHTLADLLVKPDDKIVFNGITYRVMQKWDWREYGFYEYHVVDDYTP